MPLAQDYFSDIDAKEPVSSSCRATDEQTGLLGNPQGREAMSLFASASRSNPCGREHQENLRRRIGAQQ